MLLLCSGLYPHLHTDSGSSHTCPAVTPLWPGWPAIFTPPCAGEGKPGFDPCPCPAHGSVGSTGCPRAGGLRAFGAPGWSPPRADCVKAQWPEWTDNSPLQGATHPEVRSHDQAAWPSDSSLSWGTHTRGRRDQVSYSLLRDLVALGGWYAAH